MAIVSSEFPPLMAQSDLRLIDRLSDLAANLDGADVPDGEVRQSLGQLIKDAGRIHSVNLRTLLVEYSWDMRACRFKRPVDVKNFIDALIIVRGMDEDGSSRGDAADSKQAPDFGDRRGDGGSNNAWQGREHKQLEHAKPWSCATCTFENKPDFLICEVCGVVKPASSASAPASSIPACSLPKPQKAPQPAPCPPTSGGSSEASTPPLSVGLSGSRPALPAAPKITPAPQIEPRVRADWPETESEPTFDALLKPSTLSAGRDAQFLPSASSSETNKKPQPPLASSSPLLSPMSDVSMTDAAAGAAATDGGLGSSYFEIKEPDPDPLDSQRLEMSSFCCDTGSSMSPPPMLSAAYDDGDLLSADLSTLSSLHGASDDPAPQSPKNGDSDELSEDDDATVSPNPKSKSAPADAPAESPRKADAGDGDGDVDGDGDGDANDDDIDEDDWDLVDDFATDAQACSKCGLTIIDALPAGARCGDGGRSPRIVMCKACMSDSVPQLAH